MNERTEKINSLIERELSAIILQEVDFKPGVFATISHVKTSPDLKRSVISITPFPTDQSDYILATLEHERVHMQGILNRLLHMKILPKIVFSLDTGALKSHELEDILNSTQS